MSCPICKKRQVAMLENVVAIDVILFQENSPKKVLSESDYRQYNKVKNAMLVNLYEIYKKCNYISENDFKGDIKALEKYSFERGKKIFNETCNKVKNDETLLKQLNEQIQLYENKNIEDMSKQMVLESVFKNSLDTLMLESMLEKCDLTELDNTEGELLLKAHSAFRNDLIKIATK